MDTGLKLEHVLRYLKNTEPNIEHWMEFGNVGRSKQVHAGTCECRFAEPPYGGWPCGYCPHVGEDLCGAGAKDREVRKSNWGRCSN
jgi:hypothetical protein